MRFPRRVNERLFLTLFFGFFSEFVANPELFCYFPCSRKQQKQRFRSEKNGKSGLGRN
jgi:hypothetical protein